VPYLVSPALGEEEDERYELPEVSPEAGTLLEHARRAIELVLGRGTGEHGLCRMGGGDWNDGMNRVAGESVWLTQFFAHVLGRFAALTGNAEYRAEAERFGKAANGAWDGAWFLRGYYADGRTLGSAADKSCRMDAIAQGFAALAPGTDRARLEKALKSALRALFDRKGRLVKLFAPPFSPQPDGPGYIQYYPPGIRENGGQYTHGAVWLALGCLRAGFREEARAILEALLPSAHDGAVYRAEPYVLAADVYANPEHYGRGGWTWYTGAAGWYYRVAAELLTLDEKKEKDYNGQ
jgi:cellobiose phosphorylase